MKHISYSRDAWSDQHSLIKQAKFFLDGVDFDSMVGTGLSGSLVIPILARAFDVDWAIIRKDSDKSHSDSRFEGVIGNKWVFVDDGFSTGATLLKVVSTVRQLSNVYGEVNDFVGAYLYAQDNFYRADELDI